MSKQTLEIKVPNGYELTGEYRSPREGEFYLNRVGLVSKCGSGVLVCLYPILRKKAPQKRSLWVNCYPKNNSDVYQDYAYSSKEQAYDNAAPGRIACVEVTYEVEG